MTPYKHMEGGIHPWVRHDIDRAQVIGVLHWIEVVAAVNAETLLDWQSTIRAKKWFEDTIIDTELMDYTRLKNEFYRCKHFAKLCNRIIELSRGQLSGIRKRGAYPVDDLVYMSNAVKPIAAVPEYGQTRDERSPDVIVVRQAVADDAVKQRPQWWQVLYWWELSCTRTPIAELNAARVGRGMVELELDSGLPPRIYQYQVNPLLMEPCCRASSSQ